MKKFYSLLVVLAASVCAFAQQSVTIEDVCIKAGTTAEVTLSLNGANTIKGFGAVVEGIDAVRPTDVIASTLTNEAKDGKALWTLAGKAKETTYKMAIVNMVNNSAFFTESKDLVKVVFTADASAIDGKYPAKITSIEYADGETGGLIKGTDVNFNIIVCQDPVALHAIKNGSSKSAIYNASGVQQNGMKKGVNIIKMSDGTVKKVVK